MPNTVKTLPVEVYYNNRFRSCANGGITEYCDTLYLLCGDGWYGLPDTDPRILKLELRDYPWGRRVHAVPANPGDTSDLVGPMFGASFVYSSDSRFPADYPIPVHDRYETYEQYKLLSD